MKNLVLALGFFAFTTFAFAETPYIQVALGDSITQAMNAEGFTFNQPDLSWSTGYRKNKKVISHFHRLNEALEEPVKGFNFSKSGSKIDGLKRQVDNLLRVKPDYVTLLIGANDLCSWYNDDSNQLKRYVVKLETQIGRIVDANPDVQILLTPIPDMYNLYQVGKNSCQRTWNRLRICQPLLGKRRTEAQRQAFKRRWQAMNDELERIAESYGDTIYFPDTQDYKFERSDVSKFDCFHPSAKGQNLIAEQTWNPSWLNIK